MLIELQPSHWRVWWRGIWATLQNRPIFVDLTTGFSENLGSVPLTPPPDLSPGPLEGGTCSGVSIQWFDFCYPLNLWIQWKTWYLQLIWNQLSTCQLIVIFVAIKYDIFLFYFANFISMWHFPDIYQIIYFHFLSVFSVQPTFVWGIVMEDRIAFKGTWTCKVKRLTFSLNRKGD